MTQDRLVTLRLSTNLIATIEAEARRREISAAQMIRLALADGLRRRGPDDPPRGGNYLSRPSLIAATFDAASDWLDLQRRLRAEGLVLRQSDESWGAEARIALHDWPGNHFLMWLDETGQSLAELTMRFRAPFPDPPRRTAITFPPGAFRSLRERAAERVRFIDPPDEDRAA